MPRHAASLTYLFLFLASLLLSACSSGGGGDNASNQETLIDVAGVWLIVENITSTNCEDEARTNEYNVTVEQFGEDITVITNVGTFTGRIRGNTVSWSGQYPEEGGYTTIRDLQLTFAENGTSATLTGSSRWDWRETVDSAVVCSGTTDVRGVLAERQEAAPDAPGGLEASSATESTVTLVWNDNSDNELGFKIERRGGAVFDFEVVGMVPADQIRFVDSGLDADTSYDFRVFAFNDEGESNLTEVITVRTSVTAVTAPIAPSNLNAVAIDGDVTITWQDNSDDEVDFVVLRRVPGGTLAAVAEPSENTEEATDLNVAPGTYEYTVRARNSAGVSDGDEFVSVSVDEQLPPAPIAPSQLVAFERSSSVIELFWVDESNNEDGFTVQRSAAGAAFETVATIGVNSEGFTDAGLNANTVYDYRVLAFNKSGASAYSNTARATTTIDAPSMPAAPSNLRATTLSASEISLTWNDGSNNEQGFQIERRGSRGGFSVIQTTQPNARAHTDTELAAGTSYTYRVRAFNSAGSSSYTPEVTVATESSAVPSAPSQVSVTDVSETSATIRWRDNSNNEDGFELVACSLVDNFGNCARYRRIATARANATALTISGLRPDQSYDYDLRAYSDTGVSTHVSVRITTRSDRVEKTIFATSDNTIMLGSNQPNLATSAFPNDANSVGCNWTWGPFTGSDFVCAASLIWFDLAETSGKQIVSAKLKLYSLTLAADRSSTYSVNALAQNWSAAVTWNSQPNYYVSPVQHASPPVSGAVPMEFDVTEMVQLWANGSRANRGFMIWDQNPADPQAIRLRATIFESLEQFNSLSRRPQIEIVYE
ncbi:MAG: fibronectin type III domain-containing protein [Planctomycetota bacterium]